MKTQILPNWCKKLGIILFIVTSFINGADDFLNGIRGGYNYGHQNEHSKSSSLFSDYFGNDTLHLFGVLSMLGILIYILSKEKIEDDYIDKIRLESFQLTAIVGLIITILLYSFSKDIKLTLDYFIFLFTWFYLITFFIKKRMY